MGVGCRTQVQHADGQNRWQDRSTLHGLDSSKTTEDATAVKHLPARSLRPDALSDLLGGRKLYRGGSDQHLADVILSYRLPSRFGLTRLPDLSMLRRLLSSGRTEGNDKTARQPPSVI